MQGIRLQNTRQLQISSLISSCPITILTLDDHVNITARLASEAGPGHILIRDAAYSAASLNLGDPEHQQLELQGKSKPIGVRVLHSARD